MIDKVIQGSIIKPTIISPKINNVRCLYSFLIGICFIEIVGIVLAAQIATMQE